MMTEYTKEQIAENRRAWITALCSGNYLQTKRRLGMMLEETGRIEYCCLGVACRILNLNPERTTPDGSVSFVFGGQDDEVSEFSRLTPETAAALGLTLNPGLLWHGKYTTLAALNDAFNFTFDEIASVIESQTDDWDGNIPFDADMNSWLSNEIIPRPEV